MTTDEAGHDAGHDAGALSDNGCGARHRAVAGNFTRIVDGVPPDGWDVPAPVDGWTARDVVRHLTSWFPAFLAGGTDLSLPPGPDVDVEPAGCWHAHADGVQALLDDPVTASSTFRHPMVGEHSLDAAVDQFYVNDILMHSWDLARATGQEHGLDDATCAAMAEGMESIDELLRSSGQYGPRVPVPDGASGVDRLVAFIGRDPAWTPPQGP